MPWRRPHARPAWRAGHDLTDEPALLLPFMALLSKPAFPLPWRQPAWFDCRVRPRRVRPKGTVAESLDLNSGIRPVSDIRRAVFIGRNAPERRSGSHMPDKLGNLLKVRALRVRRQIPDPHVLDHAAAKRGHWRLLCGADPHACQGALQADRGSCAGHG